MISRTRLLSFIRLSSCRKYSSPLLLSGDKLNATSNFFTPFIDIESKLEKLPKLQENVELRKLDINPEKLKSLWDFFKHLEATKVQLEKRKMEITANLNDLKKIGHDVEAKEEMQKLRNEARIVREDLKTLMKAYNEVEEKVLVFGLMLPNELHQDTPRNDLKIVHEFGKAPSTKDSLSHIDIGFNLGLIDYRDPSCFFLKNEAALFEVSCAYYFAEALKKNDFISFCNPDFTRSVVINGCRNDHGPPNSVFVIKETINRPEKHKPRLHLVGGSSIYPFCAFHAKQTVSFSSLPLRYFTIGRQYSPCSLDSKQGLFDTWQRTTNELFILTADDYNEMMSVFSQTLEIIIGLYERLDHHFRVVYVNASDLESWENLRASFQMYSPHERRYIEVGKLSISDSYICQRLYMSYQMSEKDQKERFMKMISGTAVDITKLLACLLEQREDPLEKFTMPKCLKSHWSI